MTQQQEREARAREVLAWESGRHVQWSGAETNTIVRAMLAFSDAERPAADAPASTQGVGRLRDTIAALAVNEADLHPEAAASNAGWNDALGHVLAVIDAFAAAAPQAEPEHVTGAERWQHVKRGTFYDVIGEAELQTVTGDLPDGAALVVYRGDDGKQWAREEGEFHDGRFVRVTGAAGLRVEGGVIPAGKTRCGWCQDFPDSSRCDCPEGGAA